MAGRNGFDINDLTIALELHCSSLNGAIKASWPAEMAFDISNLVIALELRCGKLNGASFRFDNILELVPI